MIHTCSLTIKTTVTTVTTVTLELVLILQFCRKFWFAFWSVPRLKITITKTEAWSPVKMGVKMAPSFD